MNQYLSSPLAPGKIKVGPYDQSSGYLRNLSILSDVRNHAGSLFFSLPQVFCQACPVGCMHKVSFEELEEMDTARNDGNGRTDHHHF